MESTTHGAHTQAKDEVWITTNLHLSFSDANILFISAIIINVFLTVWMTRGIRKYVEMTGCLLAIGMSVVALLYFAIASATLVGIRVNTIAGRCDAVSRVMCTIYLIVKAYTGVFLFKKLRGISGLLKPKWGRTARRGHVKRLYYFVFGPLVLIFLSCAILMLTCIKTSVQHQASNKSFCVIHILFPKIVLPIFTFSTLTIVSVLSFSFAVPSRLIAHQPPSTPAFVASVITAAIPFALSIYLFTMHGHEAASLVNGGFGIDVMVALCAVWYVEGSWTEDRANGGVCKCNKLPLELELEPRERDDVMASRIARMGAVKKLHLQLEMDLLQTRGSEEDVACVPSGSGSG